MVCRILIFKWSLGPCRSEVTSKTVPVFMGSPTNPPYTTLSRGNFVETYFSEFRLIKGEPKGELYREGELGNP